MALKFTILVMLDNAFLWLNKKIVEKLVFLWVFTRFQGALLLFLVSDKNCIGNSLMLLMSKLYAVLK